MLNFRELEHEWFDITVRPITDLRVLSFEWSNNINFLDIQNYNFACCFVWV
jgi:hypothetical protein